MFLLVFYTPLVWIFAAPLQMSEPPAAADAIVVFAGGVGESGKAGGGYQERVKQAVDLFQDGYAYNMIFSSGYVFAFPEADVMRGLAVDNGVLVDAALRTSDPDIYAAGDVANAYNPLLGRRIRVEHWANALHGGPDAARSMLAALRDWQRLGEGSPRDKFGHRAFVDVRDLEVMLSFTRAAVAAARNAGITPSET